MKLLYIALCDLKDAGQIGVRKKIESQLKSFQKDFITFLITQENWFFCIYQKEKLLDKKVLLTFEDIYNNIFSFIVDNQINCVYIRYPITNMWMNQLLKKLNKLKIKVILEFPTVPYDVELLGRVELEEDILYRNQLKKYVKMSTNYNGLKSVFGIPSMPLHNGINLEDIPIKKVNSSEDITLIAVATMSYWHGYDRLIKGLADYYSDKDNETKVYLKLIGSGSENSNYQNLINQYKLNEYVKLKGTLYGETLNAEFDQTDIAVGVLAQYRKNAEEASPIKTKEYCARGIPIILGHKDLAFDEKLPFILNIPNDDSNIDIKEIIKFYKIFKERSTSNEIRQYAEENLTWDHIFIPVKKYFNS